MNTTSLLVLGFLCLSEQSATSLAIGLAEGDAVFPKDCYSLFHMDSQQRLANLDQEIKRFAYNGKGIVVGKVTIVSTGEEGYSSGLTQLVLY